MIYRWIVNIYRYVRKNKIITRIHNTNSDYFHRVKEYNSIFLCPHPTSFLKFPRISHYYERFSLSFNSVQPLYFTSAILNSLLYLNNYLNVSLATPIHSEHPGTSSSHLTFPTVSRIRQWLPALGIRLEHMQLGNRKHSTCIKKII